MTCPFRKVFHRVDTAGRFIGGELPTLTLRCDKEAGHVDKRHHDPETGAEWYE